MILNTETQSHRVFIFCKTYPHGVTELFPRVRRSRELRVLSRHFSDKQLRNFVSLCLCVHLSFTKVRVTPLKWHFTPLKCRFTPLKALVSGPSLTGTGYSKSNKIGST